jgi:L-rhamnose mutarotase
MAREKGIDQPTTKDIVNGLLKLGIMIYNAKLKENRDLLFITWEKEVSALTEPLYRQTSTAPFLRRLADIVSENDDAKSQSKDKR